MQDRSSLVNVLAYYGRKRLPSNLIKFKNDVSTPKKLSEIIKNPLKISHKKTILAQAKQQAKQVSLPHMILTILNYLKRNEFKLEEFIFFNKEFYNANNSLCHSERVLLLVGYMAAVEEVNISQFKILCEAAKLHDIGKFTMLTPNGSHGRKSVEFLEEKKLINKSDEYKSILYSIIESHSTHDKSVEYIFTKYNVQINRYDRLKRLCYYLQDAEALEKIRKLNDDIIKTEDILQISLLKTHIAKTLVTATFELNDFYNQNQ